MKSINFCDETVDVYSLIGKWFRVFIQNSSRSFVFDRKKGEISLNEVLFLVYNSAINKRATKHIDEFKPMCKQSKKSK